MANEWQAGGSGTPFRPFFTQPMDVTHLGFQQGPEHHGTHFPHPGSNYHHDMTYPHGMSYHGGQHGMNYTQQGSGQFENMSQPRTPTHIRTADQAYEATDQPTDQVVVTGGQCSKPPTGSRDKNYNIAEDEVLCSAFLNVSKDSIVGTSQSNKAYWDRITDYFNEYKTTPIVRSKDSLSNHWKDIKAQTSKFAACFAEIERLQQSGKNEDDKVKDALQLYQGRDRKSKQYKYLHCWFILRNEQKWNEHVGTSGRANTCPEPATGEPASGGSPSVATEAPEQSPDQHRFQRPIGRDRAKKQRTSSSSSNSSACFEMLQKMQLDRAKFEEYMKNASKDEQEAMSSRSDKKLALQEQQVQLAARSTIVQEKMLELQQKDRVDRVMMLDLDKMSPWVRQYYMDEQKSIAAKRAAERARAEDEAEGH